MSKPCSDTLTKFFRCQENTAHIFIDLAAEMATRENLYRVIDGIGSPSGSLLKLVVFYCVGGSTNSPIDQHGREFITEDVISKFADWGICCFGPGVSETLAHRLLKARTHFLIAFDQSFSYSLSFEDESFEGLNVGILKMLRDGIGPSTAVLHMRQYFMDARDSFSIGINKDRRNAFLQALCMHWNTGNLVYYGR